MESYIVWVLLSLLFLLTDLTPTPPVLYVHVHVHAAWYCNSVLINIPLSLPHPHAWPMNDVSSVSSMLFDSYQQPMLHQVYSCTHMYDSTCLQTLAYIPFGGPTPSLHLFVFRLAFSLPDEKQRCRDGVMYTCVTLALFRWVFWHGSILLHLYTSFTSM